MTKKKELTPEEEPDELDKVTEPCQELPKTSSAMDLFNTLDAKDKALVNLILQHPAINNRQLAKETGMAEKSVYNRLHTERVKRCLEGLQKTDLDLFLECRREAIIVMRNMMMNGETHSVRVTAAKEFLKGIVPDRVQIEDKTGYNLTEEEELEIEKQLGIITRKDS